MTADDIQPIKADSAAPGRRGRAGESREKIIRAATLEFTARGLSGARVNDIAERSGVNKRMIYEYFGNKEDLWLAVLERVYEGMRSEERLLDIAGLPPLDGMQALVRFNFRYATEHPELIALLNNENLHEARYLKRSKRVPALYSPLLAVIDDLLTRGAAGGVFRTGIDPMQLYISVAALGYFYASNRHTLSTIFGRNLGSAAGRRAREEHVVAMVMGYLRP